MSWLDRFSNLWRRDKLQREIDEELEFHIDARTRDNLAAGMSGGDARLNARRRFGNRTLAHERAREADLIGWMETAARDILYAFRGLRQSPGFAAVAILTLALGIGANTAMFAVIDGVLLRPLPFPKPERLFLISYRPLHDRFFFGPGLFDRDYLEFTRRDRSFEHVATLAAESLALTGAGEAVRLPAAAVTTDFFAVLQVNPAMGRTFLPEEQHAYPTVAILSDKLWKSRFGGDPGIVGKSITLDGVAHTIVGVMPPGFNFHNGAELWRPLPLATDHNAYYRAVIGRLRPSVTPRQAMAEWQVLAANLPTDGKQKRDGLAEMLPMNDMLVAGIRRSLLIFMGAVAFVLLIACANVANLLLMRGTGRQQEIAVRAALGAGRARLVRQLLTESAVVSVCGAAGGILLALAGVPALVALAPEGTIPRAGDIHVDGPVLAFTLLLGSLTGILFGLVPALQTTGHTVREYLGRGGRAMTARRERLRSAFVVAQIALALVLLTGAGLMLKSFVLMRAVKPGFQAEKIVALSVDLPDSTYQTKESLWDFDRRALTQIGRLPGVASVAAINWLPFGKGLVLGDFHLADGRPLPRGMGVDKPGVSAAYFRVMGIRMVEGRGFTDADDAAAPGVAIVTRSVARELWPRGNALGQRLTLEDDPKPSDWLTIVGVVEDVRQESLVEKPHPAIYQPLWQVTHRGFLNHMSYVVRAESGLAAVAPEMRAALREVDSSQPVKIAAMSDMVAATTAEPGFQARLIAIFSALALALAAIGIYGVLAYAVAERTREIGIRMALGAEKGDIVGMVLRRILLLATAGLALGIGGSLAVTRVLARFLFTVKPNDPATLAAVGALLAAVAILAGLIPARRAVRVDPLTALRWE